MWATISSEKQRKIIHANTQGDRQSEKDIYTHTHTLKTFRYHKKFVCFILIRLQVDSNQKLRQNHVAPAQWSQHWLSCVRVCVCVCFCHAISYINWVQKYLCMYVFTTAHIHWAGTTRIWMIWIHTLNTLEKNSVKHGPHRNTYTHKTYVTAKSLPCSAPFPFSLFPFAS